MPAAWPAGVTGSFNRGSILKKHLILLNTTYM